MIPTLDEAETVEAALRSVGPPGPGDGCRVPTGVSLAPVVVVDGGSRDETCARARKAGARVIEMSSEPGTGRARQLQAGYEACGGDVVLFLHADTRLSRGWAHALAGALADDGVAGGAFRFGFDRSDGISPGLRVVEWGARWRSRWLGLPYGDQALFARRRVLERIGGVPQAPLMEDLDLVDAIRSHGRLALLDATATTSARRYRARGTARTAFRHLVALVGWKLGVDRGRIARWVRR